MEFTTNEMTRMLDAGIRGFTLSDKPELLGLPELWEPYFEPMWALMNESGAVANFHIGSGNSKAQMDAARNLKTAHSEPTTSSPQSKELAGYTAVAPAWTEFDDQRRLAILATQGNMSNVRIIVNLCMSSLFDRHPNLKIVSAESGIGWVPFVLECLEYQFDEMVTTPAEVGHTQGRPAEYFREHIYVMFWFEQSGPAKLIPDIGSRNILVETDVPHSTCLYPGPLEHFRKVLADVPTSDVRNILQDNAAGIYRIQL
jgi:predicted TIM-barrel fold metal-dependent hydrolase